MDKEVRQALGDLLLATLATAEELLALGDADLKGHSTHVCAQGEDVWRLVTNLIDHESEHLGQVINGRYETRTMRSPMQRLVAEWLEVRARFAGSLIGLSDDQFNAPVEAGQWSYRQVVEHLLNLEKHALKTMEADREQLGAAAKVDS